MTKDNLQEILNWRSCYKSTYYMRTNDKEYKLLIAYTNFLPQETKCQQRIWHIENNLFEIQICEFCNNDKKWGRSNGKNKYTCKTCEHKKSEVTNKHRYGGTGFGSVLTKKLSEDNQIEKYGGLYVDTVHKILLIKNYQRILTDNDLSEQYEVMSVIKNNSHPIIRILHKDCGNVSELINSTFNGRLRNNVCLCTKCLNKNYENTNYDKWIELSDNMLYKNGYDGYKTLRYVDNKKQPLRIINCPKCTKEFSIYTNTLITRINLNQEICTNCNPINKSYSSSEKQLVDFISSIYKGEILENDRKLLKKCGKNNHPLELDIFLPFLGLAIEFNGDYWHMNPKIYRADDENRFLYVSAKEIWEKDEFKVKLCEERNVKLITVWERDWFERRYVIERFLKIIINTKFSR